MTDGHTPCPDLETFQRWAIAVNDQLRNAVDAVITLQNPEAEQLSDSEAVLGSDRLSGELAAEVLTAAGKFRENPDRPAWFTPASQMVLGVSIWANFLFDYVDDTTKDGFVRPDDKTLTVLNDKVFPALDQFARFLEAVDAAGHLPRAPEASR